MTISVEEYQKLKKRVETVRREHDKAQGALEQTMKRLKEEFDCDSLKEARQLHKRLKREAAEAAEKFDGALAEFQEKWEGVLDGF